MRQTAPGWRATLLSLGLLVLAWRVAAWSSPYPAGGSAQSGTVRFALAAVGLVFLVCGVAAYLRSPSAATLLFASYGLANGLHWGGSIGVGSAAVESALLLFYLTVSVFLGAAFFLHLALVFSPPWRAGARGWVRGAIYLPAVLAAIVAVAVQASGGATASPLAAAFGTLLLLPTLLSLGGTVAFVVRLARATSEERVRFGLTPVLAGLAATVVTLGLASLGVVPGEAELIGVGYAFLPVTLLLALGRPGHRAAGG